MKTLRSTSLLLEGIIASFLFAGFISPPAKKSRSQPQYEGDLPVTGIGSVVTIYRDERGMPHIYADNEHDLYLATGYISAQERLWQMDLIRRSSTGRLSEIFGKSFIQTDLFMRCLNIQSKARLILQSEDHEIFECLNAFVEGVNAYILSCPKLPPEFRILSYKPDIWSLEDVACIIGFMGWSLGSRNMLSEIFNYRLVNKFGPGKAKQLIPEERIDEELVFPGFKINEALLGEGESFISSSAIFESLGIVPVSGSNNWAVSGKRTETGKPLLSNDMHLPLGSPGIWMQIHQVVPGKVNVTGVLIPGAPFVIAGHNEKIAWGMTNLMVDNLDLFVETVNPDSFNRYYYNGKWKNMTLKEEIIGVRGGRKDTIMVRYTHRGPVISGFQNVEDAALSMKWAGSDPSDEVRSAYLLNRAGNWPEFRKAISTFRTISQNFVYADTAGNIGLNTGGGIPVRKINGNLVRNGETDEFEWKGYIPFEQLPFSFNPETGYVSSANNKTVDENYPYYISADYVAPYRITRIRQMLEEKKVFGIDDFKRMILDQHSDFAALLTPFILKLTRRAEDLSSHEKDALAILSEWDYDMSTDLVAPSLFEFFRRSFRKNLLADELGELFDKLYYGAGEYYIYHVLKTGAEGWVDNVNTPEKETLDDIVLQSFKECVASLSKEYGNRIERWKWGSIHKIVFEHPLGKVRVLNGIFHLNSGEYSIGGSDHTVSPFFSFSEGFKAVYGASERHIFNTADWDDSYTIIPTGASGIPGTEFYLSQTDAFIEGKFYRDVFSEEAVKTAARYVLKLIPVK